MQRQVKISDSSNVVGASWDGERLDVEFKGGAVYRYDRVDGEEFGQFCSAPSAGRWVSAELVKRPDAHPVTRLRESSEDLRDEVTVLRTALQIVASVESFTGEQAERMAAVARAALGLPA